MSKRDNSIARQQAKIEKHLKKKARQVERPDTEKAAAELECPVDFKQVKADPVKSNSKLTMLWSRGLEDREGTWSWGVERDWGDELDRKEIVPFLNNYTQKTWAEIKNETTTGRKQKTTKRNRSYPVKKIEPEALDRLMELELDDMETIFRFRMNSKKRLYGFVLGQSFCTVWYDPTHKIYKTRRR